METRRSANLLICITLMQVLTCIQSNEGRMMCFLSPLSDMNRQIDFIPLIILPIYKHHLHSYHTSASSRTDPFSACRKGTSPAIQ